MKYKKGATSGAIWAIVAILAVVGGGFLYQVFFPPAQQTAVSVQPAVTSTGAQATNVGDAATLYFRAYDQAANAKGQVAATLYVRDVESGALISNAASMSATAATTAASNVGKRVQGVAFDSTYRGELRTIDVKDEQQQENLNVWTLATGNIEMDLYENNVVETYSAAMGNITLAASAVDSFDKLIIKNNNSNTALNIKMIVVDVTDTTDNLDTIDIKGWNKGTVPTMVKYSDYAFELPNAVTLLQFDELTTGAIVFDASGTNPSQTLNFTVLDEEYYLSAKDSTIRQLLKGVENDAPTPTNVGAGNFFRLVGIV